MHPKNRTLLNSRSNYEKNILNRKCGHTQSLIVTKLDDTFLHLRILTLDPYATRRLITNAMNCADSH